MSIDLLPKKQINLKSVSDLSFSSDKTVLTVRLFEVLFSSDKKLSFTGSFNPINAGISNPSVAEVKILFFSDGNEPMMNDISSKKPNSKDLSNSSNTRVLIASKVTFPLRI